LKHYGFVWQVTCHARIVTCYFLTLVKSSRCDIK
jgi:hypothetical protein